MSKCTAANGSYTCGRPAGHTGRHEHRMPIYSPENTRIGTRIAAFTDRYSPVTFHTI